MLLLFSALITLNICPIDIFTMAGNAQEIVEGQLQELRTRTKEMEHETDAARKELQDAQARASTAQVSCRTRAEGKLCELARVMRLQLWDEANEKRLRSILANSIGQSTTMESKHCPS